MIHALWMLILFSVQQEVAGPDPERAMSVLQSSVWYDSATKNLRPPSELEDPDNLLRSSDWLYVPKSPKPAANTAPNNAPARWTGNWFGGFDTQWINYLVIVLLGSALAVGAVLLYRRSLEAWMPGRYKRSAKADALPVDLTRVVDLPFEVKSMRRDPLAEAEALMQQGRYNEAIVFLFSYLLLALDQSRYIRLQKGKTNRMYVRELRQQEPLRAILQPAMLAFEDVFFGRYNLSRERFVELWNQMQEFHHIIHTTPVALTPVKATST